MVSKQVNGNFIVALAYAILDYYGQIRTNI